MQKCVEHKVQDCFIKNTHYTDLVILLYSIDIANMRSMLRQRAANANRKRNIEMRDVSQSDAVKFLKGGAING